jgi:hypothetical protein
MIIGFPKLVPSKSTDAGRRTGHTKGGKGTRRGRG